MTQGANMKIKPMRLGAIIHSYCQTCQQIGMNPGTLSYSNARKERQFLSANHGKSIKSFRISLLFGIFLFICYGIIDAKLKAADNVHWFVRYAYICPCLLGVLLYSFSVHFKKYTSMSLSILMVLGGGCIFIAGLSHLSFQFFWLLCLFYVFWYVFIGARFIYSCVSMFLTMVVSVTVSVAILQPPVSDLVETALFFLSANILGLYACYWFEYYSRKDFHLSRLLESEKMNVEIVKDEMDNKLLKNIRSLERSNTDLSKEIAAIKDGDYKNRENSKLKGLLATASVFCNELNRVLHTVTDYCECLILDSPTDSNASCQAREILKQMQSMAEVLDELQYLTRSEKRGEPAGGKIIDIFDPARRQNVSESVKY